eukprot:scaffold895_cov315-Pinguiococcus_pyrenoidosus.AAC.61
MSVAWPTPHRTAPHHTAPEADRAWAAHGRPDLRRLLSQGRWRFPRKLGIPLRVKESIHSCCGVELPALHSRKPSRKGMALCRLLNRTRDGR